MTLIIGGLIAVTIWAILVAFIVRLIQVCEQRNGARW